MKLAQIDSTLNADILILNSAANRVEDCLQNRKPGSGLSVDEINTLLKVVDFLAGQENWEKITDIASRAVVVGCGVNASLRFYRAWIEALRNDFDVGNLQAVAKHLLSKRYESSDYIALSAMACTYAGRSTYANILTRHIGQAKSHSFYSLEACAVAKCESHLKDERNKGLRLFNALVSKTDGYFTVLNFYRYALDNECHMTASNVLHYISARYPACPEPFWVGAQSAMAEKDWLGAVSSLEVILAINPSNEAACLAYAYCLESAGDLVAAKDFLLNNAGLFSEKDIELNVALGTLNKKLYERYHDVAARDQAVVNFARALKGSQKINHSPAFLHIELHDLHAGVGEERVVDIDSGPQKYWLLSVDDNCARGLIGNKAALLRCPAGLQVNDIVFLSRNSNNGEKVECLYKVTSPVVPDSVFGHVVRVEGQKFFENSIDLDSNNHFDSLQDSEGCVNFSEHNRARFFKLDNATAESIVRKAEQQIGPVDAWRRNAG